VRLLLLLVVVLGRLPVLVVLTSLSRAWQGWL
jgi:hypothetical protein